MTDILKESLAKINAEIARLQAVKVALERAGAVQDMGGVGGKAPAGSLKKAIVGVLGKVPMTNGEIRAALEKQGYAFSLTPLHVSKTLAKLVRAKKVGRVGDGPSCKYRRVG